MLSYGYFFSNVETRFGPQIQRAGASQKILFQGKLSLAARKAQRDADREFLEFRETTRAKGPTGLAR